MEVYEPLPQPIHSLFGHDIPAHIQQRLHYQWKLLHQFAKTVLALSHKASRDFVTLCDTYGADLSSYTRRRLCPYCAVIQLPAMTCSTKLRKRTRKSQVNLQQEKKLKNEVVCRCLVCSHTSFTDPGAPRVRKQRTEAEKSPTPADKPVKRPSEGSGTPGKAKFSFLATLDKKMARWTSSAISVPSGGGLETAGRKRKESDDFMAFSSTSSASSSSATVSKATRTSTSSFSSGGLNLLELEASNKKKRRKSQGSVGPTSLGSLQQLLQKR